MTVGPTAVEILHKHWPALYKDFKEDSYHPDISYYKMDGEKLFGKPQTFPLVSPNGIAGPTPLNLYPEKTDNSPKVSFVIDRHLRPALHEAILKQVRRCNIPTEYSRRVLEYYEVPESFKGGVVLEDGSRYEADVVVAADGMHTASWKLVGGSQPPARPSGNSIYRTAFPVEHMLEDPILTEHVQLQSDGRCSPLQMWMGAGAQAVLWRTDKIFSWALTHKDTGSASESWHHPISPSQILDSLKDYPIGDIFRRAIACTPDASIIDWKLMFRDSQPTWSSPGGHVVQLGDSAHTFLPSSGNGATQAMEDAASLAACLQLAAEDHNNNSHNSNDSNNNHGQGNSNKEESGAKTTIPTAVKMHCKLRFERVDCIQLLGFVNQFSRHKPDWAAVAANPRLIMPKFGRWVLEHDPEAYAEASWTALKRLFEEGREGEWRNGNVPPGYEYRRWTLDDMLRIEKGEAGFDMVGEWYNP